MKTLLHKRQIRKKLQKEQELIQREFDIVVDAFLTQLLGHNWDDPALAEYPIFQHFNDVWHRFCQWFDKDGPGKNQLIQPDSMAFYRFAIDQTVEQKPTGLVMGPTDAQKPGNEKKPGSL